MVSGPPGGTATFANANAVDTMASFSTDGDYVLRLTADDGALSVTDEMAVTAYPVDTPNQPPLVNAGQDDSVLLSETAVLDGSVTDEGLPGGPVTTTWSQVSGPGVVTFANASAEDTTAIFSTDGTYVLRLTGYDGELSASDDVTIMVAPAPLFVDVRVNASSDDAEEKPSGSVGLTSSDLELVYDGGDQQVGMRFNGVAIPPGATIVDAYVQFQVDETTSPAGTSLTIEGQAADDPPTFSSSSNNISSRPRTSDPVPWTPPTWTTTGAAGPDQRTPNIASVIDKIVKRSGWVSGNSLVIIITGTGERVAESYNGRSGAAPLLHVEYAP
jgi:hypothetical protein